jgi:N-acetylglucosamine kinase-like BadF-type ATPase
MKMETVCQTISDAAWQISNLGHEIEKAYFYTAGVVTPEIAASLTSTFKSIFPSAEIEISNDLVAAARAACGRNCGIVAILGTGSNSCLWDGEKIIQTVRSGGFILGDEGSGACLGKLMVGDLLKNQMTPELKEKFLTQFNLTPADIIDRVYRKPFPNRFLASLSPFLAQNINESCVHELVLNSFKAFFKRNIMQYESYQNLKVNLIGSVAFYYKEVLAEAAEAMGIQLGTIIQSPMEGLIKYHA